MTTAVKIPPALLWAGASGSLLIVVGPGASAPSGLPGWSELLRRLWAQARTDVGDDPQRGRLLEAAAADGAEWFASEGDETDKLALLRSVMGAAGLRIQLGELIRAARSSPTPTHRALADLPGATFATTTVDGLLEQALRAQAGGAPRVERGPGAEVPIGPGDLLELCGDADHPETLALLGDDKERWKLLETWERRLAGFTRPPWQVLLLGFTSRDPSLRDVGDALRGRIEALRGGSPGDRPSPFWLAVDGPQAWARAGAAELRQVLLESDDDVEPWLRALGEAIARERSQGPGIVLSLISCADLALKRVAQDARQAEKAFRAQRWERALELCIRILEQVEPRATAHP